MNKYLRNVIIGNLLKSMELLSTCDPATIGVFRKFIPTRFKVIKIVMFGNWFMDYDTIKLFSTIINTGKRDRDKSSKKLKPKKQQQHFVRSEDTKNEDDEIEFRKTWLDVNGNLHLSIKRDSVTEFESGCTKNFCWCFFELVLERRSICKFLIFHC